MECALKLTGTEIELLTDVNRVLDFEHGVRGRITRAVCHYYKPVINKCVIMMKQKKIHTMSILILTISTDGLYHNYFLMADLNMLKIYQCLYDSCSDFGFTLIVTANYLG